MATNDQQPKKETNTKLRYIEAVGRRKTSVARVRLLEGTGSKKTVIVNDKEFTVYFPTENTRVIAREALAKVKVLNKFNVTAKLSGGGYHSQAEALRHGISRALVKHDIEHRSKLKKGGLLKRDPRMKERKKFGKKKARKSPQWSKR